MNSEEYTTATRPMVRRHLQRMDPNGFEHFVADVWARIGWDARVVGAPGDRGIDVVGTAPDNTTEPQRQPIPK